MEYRSLGDSGLDVSVIALGTMTFGEQNSREEAFAQLDYALEQGVNFIDVAEMYPVPPLAETQGASERFVGDWLSQRGNRQNVILATKVTGRGDRNVGMEHIRGGARLSPDHIAEAIDGSLERLQTDYVDLYQVHWPERVTNFFGQLGYRHKDDDGIPIAETLEALADLVHAGKVRHIGISNETPWGLHEYLRLSREQDLPRPVSIQNPYNLLNRSFEVGLAEMAIREKVGLLAYSPLAFGVLSGKYLGGAVPEKSRLARFSRFSRYSGERVEPAVADYAALAREAGLDPAQMALAFVNQQPFTTSNIIGATTLEQLRANIASADIRLEKPLREALETLHARHTIPAP
jgi:aryl-alcohol dehydrogenase-like predicted oxidoreductase